VVITHFTVQSLHPGKKVITMIINRVWSMPNKWTFTIKPIAELLSRYVGDGKGWIDPFAGMNSPAEFTNDLNPQANAKSHLDALDFLKQLKGIYLGALFDPPYSPRQVKECYESIGRHMKQDDALLGYKRAQYKDLMCPLIMPYGSVISFGWNTVGMGKKMGFEITEILLVCHGGVHNDTIVTVEQKVNENI
jgi:hypothetical protein